MKIDELSESELPKGWRKENGLGRSVEVFTNGNEKIAVSLSTGRFNGSVYLMESTAMDGIKGSNDWDYIMDQAVEEMLALNEAEELKDV